MIENLEFKVNELTTLDKTNIHLPQDMTQRINTPGFGDELIKKRHRNKSADTFSQVSHANSQTMLNLRTSTSNLYDNSASQANLKQISQLDTNIAAVQEVLSIIGVSSI